MAGIGVEFRVLIITESGSDRGMQGEKEKNGQKYTFAGVFEMKVTIRMPVNQSRRIY